MNKTPTFALDLIQTGRGRGAAPYSFSAMTDSIQKIQELLTPLLEGTDMFVTGLKIKPTNNIKLYLDADTGLSVEKSARVNRKLRAAIEEAGLYPDGDFSLEVSSPGIDEPLHSQRQYVKNIGRTLEVTTLEGQVHLGILEQADETALVLQVKLPRKKETTAVTIPIEAVKTAVVQVVF
jgi:ribosome maturation factor RimP